jgi:hypothetical protein
LTRMDRDARARRVCEAMPIVSSKIVRTNRERRIHTHTIHTKYIPYTGSTLWMDGWVGGCLHLASTTETKYPTAPLFRAFVDDARRSMDRWRECATDGTV